MRHEVCVFVETTLNQNQVLKILPNAKIKPSIKMGDLLLALTEGFKTIVIIDGVFSLTPSVWHKEILYAMECGVAIIGCSSMGALRASELQTYGMIGFGRIFNLYANKHVNDDGEVAVSFIKHEQQLYSTIPLINIRLSLRNYKNSQLILDKLNQTHYTRRNWDNIRESLSDEDFLYLKDNYIDYKESDALECLGQIDELRQLFIQLPTMPKTLPFNTLYQKVLFENEFDYVISLIKLSTLDLNFLESEHVNNEIFLLMQIKSVEDKLYVEAMVKKVEKSGLTLQHDGLMYLVTKFRLEQNLVLGKDFRCWCLKRGLDLEQLEHTFSLYFLIRKFVLSSGFVA